MKKIAITTGILLMLAIILFFIFAADVADKGANRVIGTRATASSHARALHRQLTIVDTHSDSLLWQRNFLDRHDFGHMDLPRLQGGNVAVQILSSVSQSPRGQNYQSNPPTDILWLLSIGQMQPARTWFSPLQRTLFQAKKMDQAVAGSNGQLVAIRSRADLARVLAARAAGRGTTGAVFSVEGLHNLEGDFANMARLYDAGVRMAGLVHFFDNEVGGSMHGERKGGLTPLGRRVVADMERRGIIIDIAHSSHAAVAEILAMATRPVVSSHGGVQATCRENRNLSDDEIRGVARTGGVVNIGVWDAAVCAPSRPMPHAPCGMCATWWA
ncbi:MAG: dipeptidase [Sphingopyxis sp.]